MSILSRLKRKQQTVGNKEPEKPEGFPQTFVEMQEMLRKTNQELEDLKARLSRLENAVAAGATKKNNDRLHLQAPSPLPVHELRQLSDMAKRLR